MCECGKMNQTIMHCIFVGPPGVGKSSLLKRLLRMKLDPNHTSTQVAEKSVRVEVVRDVATSVAKVSGFEWHIIEDSMTQASGLIVQLSTISEEVSTEANNSAVEDLNKQISGQAKQVSKHQDSISPAEESEDNTMTTSPTVASSDSQIANLPATEERNESQINSSPTQGSESTTLTSKSSDSETSQFHTAIEFIRRVLKEEDISKVHVTNSCTLYLTDTGGQPEFQELLPAIAVGPSVFFVVYPLDKDLNSKYEVEYVRPDEEKRICKYTSSLTLKEDLMQSLSSIASTEYKDIFGNIVEPRVMFVATFKDKVPTEEDRQKRLTELQDLIKKTDAFRQGMIVDASRTQMVFTINNLSNEEAEKDAKKIRDAFQKIACGFKVCTPFTWLIFSILVQHVYGEDDDIQHEHEGGVICYDECFKLAQECGIKTRIEFEVALQFLHKQTGILHYYKELPELNQLVIRDPQHLFSRVNRIVERTFDFEKTQCNQSTADFERGIFRKTDYERLTEESRSSKLTPSMLLKLLEYLNVVVPLGDGERYFMPCAITHLDEVSSIPPTVPPLLITFKSGYCPKGLFGVLVACIANKQVANCTLNLDESKIHRNQICFTMDQHSLLLRVNPTYIYIEVIPYSPDTPLSTLCTPCNRIRELIFESIKIACKALHYSDSIHYRLSFECPCNKYSQQEKFHPAVLRDDLNNRFWCIQSKKVVDVMNKCYVWLPQVSISHVLVLLVLGLTHCMQLL